MSKWVLALDQGTSSSRAILFDHAGLPVSVAQREFAQYYPQPGWVEHDALEIWDSQRAVLEEVLSKANASALDLAAIGLTNQRETTIVWNRKTGLPVCRAIVWQDRRTAGLIDRLKHAGLADLFQARTGLVLDAYFSGSKLAWILEHVPDARAQAENGELAFGTVDSWLVYQLTNRKQHITDVSNASRTLLFNIHTLQWDDELLEQFNIPRALLPEVESSSQVYAETAIDVFDKPVPIAGIAGDQQAATFGQACFQSGFAKNTYGTGCFMMLNTGGRVIHSQNQLLSTIAWSLNSSVTYALEGSVFIGGAIVKWLRDSLGIIRASSEIESLARSVKDNGGVYFVPALAGLGAPHWDQHARGTIMGLTGGSNKAHLARAALESIAFQVVDVAQAMMKDSGVLLNELRVDGGAANNELLLQIQADLLNVPVLRTKVIETTALGAAYLAGLAVGFWPDQAAITAQWSIDKRFEPQLSSGQREQLLADWHRAVERCKGWVEPL